MSAAGDLLIERGGTGRCDGLEPVNGHHREDVDELAVPIGMLGQALAQPRHRGGQVPVLERRAVAQRPGLFLERLDVVPGVVDDLATGKAPGVLADDSACTDHHDPLGISAHRGHAAHVAALNAVAVVLPHVILLPDASQEMLLRPFLPLRILFSGKAPCSLPPKVAEGRRQDDSPITIALRRHPGSFLCCRRLAASQPRGATPAVFAAS